MIFNLFIFNKFKYYDYSNVLHLVDVPKQFPIKKCHVIRKFLGAQWIKITRYFHSFRFFLFWHTRLNSYIIHISVIYFQRNMRDCENCLKDLLLQGIINDKLMKVRSIVNNYILALQDNQIFYSCNSLNIKNAILLFFRN